MDEKSCGVVVFRDGGRGTGKPGAPAPERLYLVLHYEEGHWDFPKGHVERGEEERETARREVREETGLDDLAFVGGFRERIEYAYARAGRLMHKEVFFFLARTRTRGVKLSHEHVGCEWLPYEKAAERLTYPNAKVILKKARAFLRDAGIRKGHPMELQRIGSGSRHFAAAWELYESAFPPDERRSMEAQKAAFKRPEYRLFAALENGAVAGFLSLWEFAGFVFMEHLAVQPRLRGKGVGAAILRRYMSSCRKNVVLEVEPPRSEIQKRRVAFYERLGFRLNRHKYTQPSYGPGKNPVPMLVMSYPGAISEGEFPLLRKGIHMCVYGLKEPLV